MPTKFDKQSASEKIQTLSDIYRHVLKFIPNPSKLIQQHGFRLFSETLADSTVQSVVNTILDGVSSFEWDIISDNSSQDEIDLTYKTIQNLIDQDIIKKILYAIFYGGQYLNLVWKDDGKFFIIDKVYDLPHDSIKFNLDNQLYVLTPDKPFDGVEVLPYQVLPVVYNTNYLNPYGSGLFLNCYKYVFIKNNVLDFWTIFTEEYGSPGIKGSYTQAAAQSFKMDQSKFIDYYYSKLLEMRESKIITHPEGTTVDMFPSGTTQSAEIYKGLIDICNKEITKLILGHDAGAESTPGKLGNEDMALSNKGERIESYKNFFESYFNKILKFQHDVNFSNSEPCQIKLFQKDDITHFKSKAEVANLLKNLGVTFTDQYFIDEFNLKEDQFTISTGTLGNNKKETKQEIAKEDDTEKQNKAESKKPFFNLLRNEDDNNDDKYTQSLLDSEKFAKDIIKSDDYKDLINAQYEQLAEILNKYDSYDDMLKNVFKVFDDIDVKDLSLLIEKFNLVSRVIGFNGGVEDASVRE